MKHLRQLLFLSLLGGFSVLGLGQYTVSCGNDETPPPPGNCEDNGDVGTNPVNPYKGDLHRSVTDITTYGEAPIPFTRIFHSRTLTFNTPYWDFGSAQTWQHNWNHEMRQLSSKTFGFFDIKLRYADGREYNFVAADASGAQLVPPAANGDRLYRWPGSTVGYTLITPQGEEYHFQRVGSPKFRLKQVRDGKGHAWTLTHDANAKIVRIANAYGRHIDIQRGMVGGVECITRVSTSDGRNVDYTYGTWAPTNTPVLTAITYPDGEAAAYTWVGSDSLATGRPLLATASDPMYGDAGALTTYTYNYNAVFNFGDGTYLVTGTVLSEKNLATGATIVSLPLGGGPNAQIVQGNGSEVSRLYDKGQLVGKRDAAGRLTSFTRDSGGYGFIAARTEPGGGTTTYTRDYAGRILTRTNAYNHTRAYAYNSAGFLLSSTDELGRVTTFTRDSMNRPTRVDHPDGTYETWTYNSTGQILTHRRAHGGIETRAYYTAGQTGGRPGDLRTITDPLGKVTTYTYAASGLRLTATDPLGRTTAYAYTPGGRLSRVTYPDSTYRDHDYDQFGNLIQLTDELGHATGYTYNEYQRVASVTDPLGRTTSYAYGLSPSCGSCGYVDLVTRITYPSGRKIERTYDPSGKLLAETDGAGTAAAATTTRAYSTAGNLASITTPLGHATTYAYDLLNRVVTQTDPLSRVTTTTYDAVGNLLTLTRADGAVTSTTYDARNRPATRTDATGNVIAYTYDGEGRLAALTDARSATTTWTYDLAGRLFRKTYANATYEENTYDHAGQRVLWRSPAGVTRACAYDLRGRETTCDWSDSTPDVVRAYDSAGRLTSLVTSGVVTHTYAYDSAGQLLSETSAPAALAPATFTVSYAYDADGRRSTLGYPDGTQVATAYTARGQIASISAGGPPPLATFAYDLAGRRTQKTLENGVSTSYAYDMADQLTTLVHSDPLANELARLAYAYDLGGRRTAKTITGGAAIARAETYGYDAIDQVTSAGYGASGAESFAYDAMGNRTSATLLGQGSVAYAANNLNQYTSVGGSAPSYDVNGNTLTLPGRTFAYDGQSRMIVAQTVGLGGVVTHSATFVYDARNRQVSRTVDGQTTFFIWDGWSLLADGARQREDGQSAGLPAGRANAGARPAGAFTRQYRVLGGTPTQTARYIHGPRLDEVLVQIRATSPSPVYLHEDALGSTYLLTNAAGAAVERYSYTAFGEVRSSDMAGNPVAAPATRFLYTGREWISEVGINDHRHRFYLPSLSRWLSRDPIKERGGLNLYGYVGNNAINAVDPLGLMIMPPNAWLNLPTTPGGQQVGTIHSRPMDPATPIISGALTHAAGGYLDHFFLILDDGTELAHGGNTDPRPGDITVPLRVPNGVDPQRFKECMKKNWPDPGTYNPVSNNCRQGLNDTVKKCIKEAGPKAPPKPPRPWWLPPLFIS